MSLILQELLQEYSIEEIYESALEMKRLEEERTNEPRGSEVQ